VSELGFSQAQLIQPLFLAEGITKEEPLSGLPGNSRHTLGSLLTQFEKDMAAGVRQFLLFPVPAHKSNRNFAADFVGTALQPLANSVGMHPVHFAIIGIVSLAFGLITPPYGLCLMIACAVAKVRLRYALKDTMIMLAPMLLVLAAIIVWPEVALILPRLISPEFLK